MNTPLDMYKLDQELRDVLERRGLVLQGPPQVTIHRSTEDASLVDPNHIVVARRTPIEVNIKLVFDHYEVVEQNIGGIK